MKPLTAHAKMINPNLFRQFILFSQLQTDIAVEATLGSIQGCNRCTVSV